MVWRTTFALMLVAYMLPGLFGHEPWKPDEPYTFGIVRDMLASGDWIVPTVDGVPFVEKPPLYYWAAAATTWLFDGVLPLHDAARITTALFVALTIAATALAARLCWGAGGATRATLLLLATLGLEGHAQWLQVDIGLMAGFAVALLGFAGLAQARAWGGVALGLGAAMGFLAKGLLAPAAIGLAAILLPALFASWRHRSYAWQVLIAVVVVMPAGLWPLALWQRDPALFHTWFWDNNIGRFLGDALPKLGATSEPGFWPQTLPWFLFPLWLFALGAIYTERARIERLPGMQIGLVVSGIVLATLIASASGRAVYALSLLPTLTLVAVAGVRLPEGLVARTLGHTSIALAAAMAAASWVIWFLLLSTHDVPAWLRLHELLPVPFAMPFDLVLVAAAVTLTAGFCALVVVRERLPFRGLTLWVGTVTLTWGLMMTLWLPWLDTAKGYRDVFAEARSHVPTDAPCIFVEGFGESERAMAAYYLPSPPHARMHEGGACTVLLWRGKAGRSQRVLESGWLPVWEGHRAGDIAERFRIFVRPMPQ